MTASGLAAGLGHKVSRGAHGDSDPRRMIMDTDGNAIAGMLEEIFAREMTGTQRVCQSCRTRNQIGAHRVYQGAGVVLRCPVCGDVAATIAALPQAHAVSIHGTWMFSTQT
jgi:Family of unknown function (DUF6510)